MCLLHQLPAHRSQPLQVVEAYNADPAVHGILVQLPLPKHINEKRVLDAISLGKDVDGFHPANIGALAMRGRNPLFVPCTPKVGGRGGVRRGCWGGVIAALFAVG
jgi:5,10-methylene-tetrahydrofolate dehydrogenase/methenyl tetrahydrofolate cyclohydrolase